MKSAADARDDGSSSSTSCVVDSLLENETNRTVGVNNCVNISSNALDDTSCYDDNDFLLSDRSVVDPSPIYECIASELDDPTTTYDAALARKIEEDILNKFLFNDDDTLTSSKYSDVTSRCEPSTSSTPVSDSVVVPSPYASTRDNNRNHRKAVRKNFSLWIGVTSCVWGLLLLLMKNYVD